MGGCLHGVVVVWLLDQALPVVSGEVAPGVATIVDCDVAQQGGLRV